MAGPSPPSNLPPEVMGTPLIRRAFPLVIWLSQGSCSSNKQFSGYRLGQCSGPSYWHGCFDIP